MLAARSPTPRPTRDTPRLSLRGAKPADQTDPKVGLRFESKARRRELLNLIKVKNAAKHLDHLPPPGCSIHGIMRGNYSFGDLVPAILTLIAPATLSYLAITTLGFSRRAAQQLLDLLDSHQVARLDFVCAHVFAEKDSEICQQFRANLHQRGSRFAAARCHAKILLLKTTAPAYYVSESSANIRACQSLEQFALTNDRALFAFHCAWIADLVQTYATQAKA